jgi:hypothetical protein
VKDRLACQTLELTAAMSLRVYGIVCSDGSCTAIWEVRLKHSRLASVSVAFMAGASSRTKAVATEGGDRSASVTQHMRLVTSEVKLTSQEVRSLKVKVKLTVWAGAVRVICGNIQILLRQ